MPGALSAIDDMLIQLDDTDSMFACSLMTVKIRLQLTNITVGH